MYIKLLSIKNSAIRRGDKATVKLCHSILSEVKHLTGQDVGTTFIQSPEKVDTAVAIAIKRSEVAFSIMAESFPDDQDIIRDKGVFCKVVKDLDVQGMENSFFANG